MKSDRSASFWSASSPYGKNVFVKKIFLIPMILLALFSNHPICEAATIRGSVKEIHSGAGKASAANQVMLRYIEELSAVPIFRK